MSNKELRIYDPNLLLDFYETKPPGTFYCYAFIISLFELTLEGCTLDFCSSTSCPFSLFFAAVPWFLKGRSAWSSPRPLRSCRWIPIFQALPPNLSTSWPSLSLRAFKEKAGPIISSVESCSARHYWWNRTVSFPPFSEDWLSLSITYYSVRIAIGRKLWAQD